MNLSERRIGRRDAGKMVGIVVAPLLASLPLAACAETITAAQPTPLPTSLAKEPEKPKEVERPIEPGWSRVHSINGFFIDKPIHWRAESRKGRFDRFTMPTENPGSPGNKAIIEIVNRPLAANVTFETYMRKRLEDEQEIREQRWTKEEYEKTVEALYRVVMKGPIIRGQKVPIMWVDGIVSGGLAITEVVLLLKGESWHIFHFAPPFDDIDPILGESSINLFSQKVVPSFRFDEQYNIGKTPLPIR